MELSRPFSLLRHKTRTDGDFRPLTGAKKGADPHHCESAPAAHGQRRATNAPGTGRSRSSISGVQENVKDNYFDFSLRNAAAICPRDNAQRQCPEGEARSRQALKAGLDGALQ